MNNFDIVTAVREHYRLIFNWYKEHGHTALEKVVQKNQSWERGNEIIAEYKATLEKMPQPENTTLEEMHLVANKVRSGVLERNYSEKVGDDMTLGEVATKIIELYKKIKNLEEFEKSKDLVYAITDYDIRSDYEYFERAASIYKNILLDNDRNIGGRVVLADTNWEVQKISNERNKLLFRTPLGLNLKEVQGEEDNLFQLALDGKILITNISVK